MEALGRFQMTRPRITGWLSCSFSVQGKVCTVGDQWEAYVELDSESSAESKGQWVPFTSNHGENECQYEVNVPSEFQNFTIHCNQL